MTPKNYPQRKDGYPLTARLSVHAIILGPELHPLPTRLVNNEEDFPLLDSPLLIF
jgi:hypothetical protein